MTHEQIRSAALANLGTVIMQFARHSRAATIEAVACNLATILAAEHIRPPERFARIDVGKLADAVLSAAISAVKEEAREQLGE